MNVVGKGDTPYIITSRHDVGRFVAHVLVTAPKSALEGAKIPFEAERLSPMQIHELAEQKLSKKIEVRSITYENLKKFNSDFTAFLTALGEDGRAVAGTKKEVAKFFPDLNPTKY